MKVAGVLLAALVAAPVAAADWLQPGFDGARHAVSPEAGPARPDVAFHLEGTTEPFQVPSGQWSEEPPTEPLVVNGTAYVLRQAQPEGTRTFCGDTYRSELMAIPLAAGVRRVVATFDTPRCFPKALASDGRSVYVAIQGRLLGYDVATDTLRFNVSIQFRQGDAMVPDISQALPAGHAQVLASCGDIAIDGGKAYLACSQGQPAGGLYPYLAIVDLEASSVTTTLLRPAPEPGDDPPDSAGFELGNDQGFAAMAGNLAFQHVAAAGGRVAVTAVSSLNGQAQDQNTGTTAGSAGIMGYAWLLDDAGTILNAQGRGIISLPSYDAMMPSAPTLLDGAVLQRFGALYLLPADGPPRYVDADYRDGVSREWDAGSSCAATTDALYCPFGHRLYRLDRDFGVVWRQDLPEGQVWGPRSVVVAGGVLYGLAIRAHGETTVVAKEAKTGADLWAHRAPAAAGQARMAVADGLLVMNHEDGTVTLLGHAPFSPQPALGVGTRYPGVGDLVRLDLSQTTPGLGASREFMVDWGDGTASEWSSAATLEHRYSAAEDVTATAFVRNDAGQTASAPLVFHVGQKDPSTNILNAPFTDRYQNTSFFILGLLATALAGAIGIARTGRKRRRFHRELRELEADYDQLKLDARGCDDMLARRKAAARALFLEKRLEEAHSSFLERRVDELRRGLRLGTIEEKLKFLPYGMVAHLQRLLQDARVDEWERQHFLDALDKQADLSPAQRASTRKLIDEWFARDAGGRA